MIYKEEVKDLFSVSDEFYLVQCISADFKLSKGIAVEFNKRYAVKSKITELYPKGYLDSNGCYESVGCVLVDRVFNLITKKRYFYKPTYHTIECALDCMSTICEDNGIKKIAMPTIGCGLDRLQWDKVSESIQRVFQNKDLEILVCKRG